jgi:hypothetical protein
VTAIIEQPPPRATERRPAWDLVIEHVEGRRPTMAVIDGVIDQVIGDMRERDRVGRERYGVPLTSGNGRDHLVDAYFEALDLIVYLATELDEHGVALDEPIVSTRPDCWRLIRLQSMLWDHVRTIVQLRAMIEERTS